MTMRWPSASVTSTYQSYACFVRNPDHAQVVTLPESTPVLVASAT
ncbi:MAG: hypothetical protein BWX84_03130 [Verrucomicrobia bacterium ADurb.Bin118]|nr:MAG: hypothetical protein BWX84_03130 [Verrucomicrobia bacterium ADurb.Bin118]